MQPLLPLRSPLPLPPSLCVSRNHFNLEWIGERRIKNAVMVLEWIPSVSKLRPLPCVTRMSEPQQARLLSALQLRDFDSTGFVRDNLREALRSAEDLEQINARQAEFEAVLVMAVAHAHEVASASVE